MVSENVTLDDLYIFSGESNTILAEKICNSISTLR